MHFGRLCCNVVIVVVVIFKPPMPVLEQILATNDSALMHFGRKQALRW